MPEQGPIHQVRPDAGGAHPGGLDRLVPLVYDELRRIARRQLRGERSDHTLDTNALVHEARELAPILGGNAEAARPRAKRAGKAAAS